MKNQEEIINALDAEYYRMISNEKFKTWRDSYKRSLQMYFGSAPFNSEVAKEMKKRGIPQVTVNLICPLVNSLCGVEIQNRFRIRAVIDSPENDARTLCEAMNSYLVKVQEMEGVDQQFSTALKDAVIGGLGWVFVGYEDRKAKIERVNPFNVIFEAWDESAFLPSRIPLLSFIIGRRSKFAENSVKTLKI